MHCIINVPGMLQSRSHSFYNEFGIPWFSGRWASILSEYCFQFYGKLCGKYQTTRALFFCARVTKQWNASCGDCMKPTPTTNSRSGQYLWRSGNLTILVLSTTWGYKPPLLTGNPDIPGSQCFLGLLEATWGYLGLPGATCANGKS